MHIKNLLEQANNPVSDRQYAILQKLGIKSVESLISRVKMGNTKAWSNALGLNIAEMETLLNQSEEETKSFWDVARTTPAPPVRHGANPPAGVSVSETKVTDVEALLRADQSVSQASVLHINKLTPVKNQSSRGTCVAFASCAYREFHSAAIHNTAAGDEDFSEQFLYWWCKEQDGEPNKSGTWLNVALRGLTEAGVCLEPTWPYQRFDQPGNEAQGPPPVNAAGEALGLRINGPTMLADAKNYQVIREHLNNGRVVTLAVQTYPFWNDAATWRSGEISLPLGEDPSGGHAILLVGFNDAEEHFVFRNSWGEEWACNSNYARGHGTLPYAYVAQDGWEGFF